jgi:hypothetical protein
MLVKSIAWPTLMSYEQDLQIDWHKLRKAGSEPPASLLMERLE